MPIKQKSSELQFTPQLTPLFAYMLYLGGPFPVKKNKLKIKFHRRARYVMPIIGWGKSHKDSMGVQPYVLLQGFGASAAYPLNLLLYSAEEVNPNLFINDLDAECLIGESNMYALIRISKKKPSRKDWEQTERLHRMLLAWQVDEKPEQDSEEPEAAAHPKKKKKKQS